MDRNGEGDFFFIMRYVLTSFLCSRSDITRKGRGTRGKFDAFLGVFLTVSTG